MKNFINFLPPWVETNIQPAFYDKESGSCLQQTARMYAKVNQLVRIANEQWETIQDYINKFIELKDYVEDYFDNLDVQEEINNKLDALVEDGTMNEIINQEIFGSINERLDLLDQKKYIFLGDSYCEGWTPDGNVNSWAVKLKGLMGLTDANCTIAYHGGYGFSNPNASFASILNGLTSDDTVTDIVVCGGYNDKSSNYTAINTGMTSFENVANTKFPNAKIHVGFIGFSNNASDRNNFRNTAVNYYRAAQQHKKMTYLTNVEYSLKLIYAVFASDGYHPNETGQLYIADNIKNALLSGSADMKLGFCGMSITPAATWDVESSNLDRIGTSVINGCTFVENTTGLISLKSTDGISWTGTGNSWIEVGTITAGNIVGNNYNSVTCPVNLILRVTEGSSHYIGAHGLVKFEGGKMYLAYNEASGGNYVTHTVKDIQIGGFSGCFNSLFC